MAEDLPEYEAFALEYGCACDACNYPPEFHHPKHQPTRAPWDRSSKTLPGKPGKGQRCSDWFGFGLCPHHHAQLHGKRGQFENMSKEELRAWQDKETAKMQNRWAMRHPDRLPELVTPPERPSRLRRRRKIPIKLRAVMRLSDSPAAVADAGGGPTRATDALTRAWVAGANAERARIADFLFDAAARIGAPDAHQALIDAHTVLRDRTEPMATP